MNNETLILVTFFDSNYLPKAIETYNSLLKYENNFYLYAYCFDDLSFTIIKRLNLNNFIPVSLKEFESKELLATKDKKTKQYEYYWAYKPYLILKTMNRTGAEIVTYIDCDFRFFQSPREIFDEIDDGDVLLQPNNFSSEEDKQFVPVGYYCSCFESFRNNRNGKKILKWWHKRCVEWCKASFEEDKFADQKYLDKWRLLFRNVKEITTVGANIAPWNIQKYDLSKKNGKVLINKLPLIYYHYHSFRMNIKNYSYIITGDRENFYRIPASALQLIYKPYIEEIKKITAFLKEFPEYTNYVNKNSKSMVHLINGKGKYTFDSYK